jgi:xanthine dehydrogenase iron-sulfur cluster and FAD-binding subunit A
MLMAAADLLARNAAPDESAVKDALGGVLCRCTGYQKIIEAVLDVANRPRLPLRLPDRRSAHARRRSTAQRNLPASNLRRGRSPARRALDARDPLAASPLPFSSATSLSS